MLPYCLNCKRNIESINPSVSKTNNAFIEMYSV